MAKKALKMRYLEDSTVRYRLGSQLIDKIKPANYVLVYCIKGITSGYLKSSPFEALILAIIIQITFKVIRNPIIGNPIIIKHKGAARTI